MKVTLLKKLRKESQNDYRVKFHHGLNSKDEVIEQYSVEKFLGALADTLFYHPIKVYDNLEEAIEKCEELRSRRFKELAIAKINKRKRKIIW